MNIKIIFSSQKIADNRFVVPHNPYLLLKVRCHINIEVFNTIYSLIQSTLHEK